jgi:hypothetical protein
VLHGRLSTLSVCALALSLLLQAACAKATIEDRGRGVDDQDASSTPKPVLPDARPPVVADAGGLADASDRDAGPAPDGDCSTAVDLLSNGNLDEGAGVGWSEASAGGFPLVVAEGDANLPAEFVVSADTAPFMMYLGGYDSAVDQAQQDFAVPADAAGLHLRGAVRIDTLETQPSAFDQTFIEIASTGGVLIEELARFNNLDDTEDQYVRFDIPLAIDVAGQTVRLQLRTAADPTLDTHFFFDSLSLEASSCSGRALQ